MRPTVFLVNSLLIIVSSPNESHARLIGAGGWWWSSSNKVSTTPILQENIADGAVPVSNNNSDSKIQQQEPAAKSRPTLTGTRLFATLFDVDNDENSDDDACYNCCCDRNVVCNSPHGKSEATCHRNACNNGATCQSKGYTCPSYNCEEVMW
ncbi:hypothetical protein IV203_025727 [Nitzschia inconspicua]|uniref:Uncharacterized protein n=1 Tax=Nitzschia inconspicua TaxID=303405 RepID=A0A9K3LJS0_9STRA|nr:hypothetical protein IV203_025727 [Nitzschia inconspicua]